MDADARNPADASWDVPHAVYGLLFAITAVQYVCGMGLFWHRRAVHPVRGHSLALVTMIGTYQAVQALFLAAWQLDLPVTCWMFVVLQLGPGLSICCGYLVRAFRIYHYYTVAAAKAKRDHENLLRGAGLKPVPTLEGAGMKSVPTLEEASRSSSSHDCTSDETPEITEKNDSLQEQPHAAQLQKAQNHQRVPSASNVFNMTPLASLDAEGRPKPRRQWRWVWTDTRFAVLMVGLSVAMTLLMSISLYRDAEETDDGECRSLENSESAYFLVLCLCALLMFVAVWKLRRVYDAYRIKKELALVAMWMMVSLVFFAYSALVPSYAHSFYWAYIVISNFMFFHTLTWKALISYDSVVRRAKRAEIFVRNLFLNPMALHEGRARHRRKRSGSRFNLMTKREFALYFNLERCLADPEASVAFEESLKREWAIENLLFYRTVSHFSASFDEPDVTRHDHEYMARAIFEEFIERGANSQVNISAACYDRLIARMHECMPAYTARRQSPHGNRRTSRISRESTTSYSIEAPDFPRDLFDDASAMIFSLMETDSFVRFKNSSLFRAIADALRRQHSDPNAHYVRRRSAPSLAASSNTITRSFTRTRSTRANTVTITAASGSGSPRGSKPAGAKTLRSTSIVSAVFAECKTAAGANHTDVSRSGSYFVDKEAVVTNSQLEAAIVPPQELELPPAMKPKASLTEAELAI